MLKIDWWWHNTCLYHQQSEQTYVFVVGDVADEQVCLDEADTETLVSARKKWKHARVAGSLQFVSSASVNLHVASFESLLDVLGVHQGKLALL